MQQAMTITVASCKLYNEFEYVSTFVKSLISFINSLNNVLIFVTLHMDIQSDT
jgi:hypothetical protein